MYRRIQRVLQNDVATADISRVDKHESMRGAQTDTACAWNTLLLLTFHMQTSMRGAQTDTACTWNTLLLLTFYM